MHCGRQSQRRGGRTSAKKARTEAEGQHHPSQLPDSQDEGDDEEFTGSRKHKASIAASTPTKDNADSGKVANSPKTKTKAKANAANGKAKAKLQLPEEKITTMIPSGTWDKSVIDDIVIVVTTHLQALVPSRIIKPAIARYVRLGLCFTFKGFQRLKLSNI